MRDKASFEEMNDRIRHVMEFYGGKLPPEHALVWEGYIAALVEWQLISITEHDKLLKLLGNTVAAPGLTIFLGPEGAQEVMDRDGPTRRRAKPALKVR